MMPSQDEFSITPYNIVVDYNMSLEEMVDAGKYDWGNKSISTANFPFQGSGKVNLELQLVCFGKDTQYEEVLKGLDSLGLRPGNLPELLSLGAAYPHLQLEYPIVQLGTIWQNVDRSGRRGLYLRRGNKERGLSAIWLEHGFLRWYRFIAVNK